MLKSIKIIKFISLMVCAVMLGACSSTQNKATPEQKVVSLESVSNSPAWYLVQAQTSKSVPLKQRYSLLAAQAYLQQGDINSADALLQSMGPNVLTEPELQAKFDYLQASLLQLQGKPAAALAKLDYPSNWSLADWQWRAYYTLKARLYQQLQQPVEQVKQLSLLATYLAPAQRSQVNDAIWSALQPLNEQQLADYTDDSTNPVFVGWMQLAYLAEHFAIAPSELVKNLGLWQQQHPDHPAAYQLPTELNNALNTQPYQPSKVAVLLPLSGPQAGVAEPVKQGLLSNYLSQNNAQLEMLFFDTADNVVSAYQAAQQAGAEFIVGPLLPDNVNKLQTFLLQADQQAMVIPQLFLNQPRQLSSQTDQYYFALSPSQEASNAAQRLHQDGVLMPLLLVSDTGASKRMAEAFRLEWMQLTDKDAEIHFYPNGDKMGEAVKSALGVTDSEARIARLKVLIGSKLEADFRSRRDIDAIYMIASSGQLTLLKPFIDVSFSVFAEPVPLYTNSRGRLETDTSKTAIELNNITFSDIPWLIKPNDEAATVSQLWPTWRNSQKRLYVMGYDAFDLIGRLAQMRAFPGYQFQGRSGELSVTPEGRLERQLSWGKYQRGKLKPL